MCACGWVGVLVTIPHVGNTLYLELCAVVILVVCLGRFTLCALHVNLRTYTQTLAHIIHIHARMRAIAGGWYICLQDAAKFVALFILVPGCSGTGSSCWHHQQSLGTKDVFPNPLASRHACSVDPLFPSLPLSLNREGREREGGKGAS